MIYIFGDSFAADVNGPPGTPAVSESWPSILKDTFNHEIINEAWPMTSIFWSFEKFMYAINRIINKQVSVSAIIFCYSSYERSPKVIEPFDQTCSMHQYNNILAMSKYSKVSDEEKEIFMKIAEGYIYNLPAMGGVLRYLNRKIFLDVNRICRQLNIRLINVFPFGIYKTIAEIFSEVDKITDEEISGVVLDKLYDISKKEFDMTFLDKRQCHLTFENNMVFASLINDFLHSQENNFIDLTKLDCWIFDAEINKRYCA